MPINQLERHPYLNYKEELNLNLNTEYTGLVIGSFPIYACSNLVDANLEVFNMNNMVNDIRFRFFYGSNNSQFWDYLFKSFGDNREITIENCINLLENKKLIITDSLFQINRVNFSSSDEDLMIHENVEENILNNLELNHSIKDILKNNSSIKSLFFTSTGIVPKSPYGWFKTIFENNVFEENIIEIGTRRWSCNLIINEKRYNVFMLPTPKPRGIHFTDNQQNPAFINYLQSIDLGFYNQIANLPQANRNEMQENQLTQYRKLFLIENYRQAFVYENLEFNGNLI